MNLVTGKIDIFLLILARVSGIFTTAPIFSFRNIPVQVRAGLAGLISLIILPVVPVKDVAAATNIWGFALMISSELLIGLTIGFVASFIFTAIQLGGEVIDMQVGFSMVNVIDPMFGRPVPLIGTFQYMIALLVFLATNSHYYIFIALVDSFKVVTLGNATLQGDLFQYMMLLAGNIFSTAVKLALPIAGAILVAEIALGLVARTVPQVNVFIVGIPGKIFLGLVMIMITLPLYTMVLNGVFNQDYHALTRLIQLMR